MSMGFSILNFYFNQIYFWQPYYRYLIRNLHACFTPSLCLLTSDCLWFVWLNTNNFSFD
jgi:hypothetical protein